MARRVPKDLKGLKDLKGFRARKAFQDRPDRHRASSVSKGPRVRGVPLVLRDLPVPRDGLEPTARLVRSDLLVPRGRPESSSSSWCRQPRSDRT